MECTKMNCPMQAGTTTDRCGDNCPWRTAAKDGDLISRAAAIKAIRPLLYSGNCVSTLINMPAVDAAPVKHGRWTTKRTWQHDGEWYCSVCDYEPIVFMESNYCPECGAKMDGEKSGEAEE